MNYEVREECHSKFEDPVPEEKKNICDCEDVSCLKKSKKKVKKKRKKKSNLVLKVVLVPESKRSLMRQPANCNR